MIKYQEHAFKTSMSLLTSLAHLSVFLLTLKFIMPIFTANVTKLMRIALLTYMIAKTEKTLQNIFTTIEREMAFLEATVAYYFRIISEISLIILHTLILYLWL